MRRGFLLPRMSPKALALILLAACAEPLSSQAAEKSSSDSSGGNVAVISLLGDAFHSSYIGASVFSKRRYHTNVPSWEMDKYVEDLVAERIRNNGKHRVISFSPRRETFRKIYKAPSRWDHHARNYDTQQIASALALLHSRHKVDRVLFVLSNEVKDPTNKEANISLAGYGLYRNEWLGGSTFIHLFARLLVVDARHAQVTAEALLSETVKVANELWHEGLAQASAKDRQVIRQEAEAAIRSGALNGLVETGFASADSAQEDQEEAARSDAYRQAVRELHKAFAMESLFMSYAREYVDGKLAHNTGGEIYADVYRRWLQKYFNRTRSVSALYEIYRARSYTLSELQSFAVLAKSERTRSEINRQQFIQSAAHQVWERLTTPASLDGLARSVAKRRDVIRQEAARAVRKR